MDKEWPIHLGKPSAQRRLACTSKRLVRLIFHLLFRRPVRISKDVISLLNNLRRAGSHLAYQIMPSSGRLGSGELISISIGLCHSFP
jgi:hypothetical protein